MSKLENNQQRAEEKLLSKQERYALKMRQKEQERKIVQRRRVLKKTAKGALVILIAGGVIAGLVWYILAQPNLPPTIAQGHTEDMPQAHVSDKPIPDSMQRHMLEHADGKGKPGVLIQYNCKRYSCEPDLVQKLTDLVRQYPDNVYLAPNNYDGKIILTKFGKIEILDGFTEQAIKNFVE